MTHFQRATLSLLICCASCDALIRVCTEIGCNDGVTILVTGAPASGATVTVREPGQAPVVMTCPNTASCAGFGVRLENRTPTSITIEVTSVRGTVSTTASPTYSEWRPNGDDCPPICHNGTIAVAA